MVYYGRSDLLPNIRCVPICLSDLDIGNLVREQSSREPL